MMVLKFQLDFIICVFNGGEDYEFIFMVDLLDLDKVKYLLDIYIMGEIVLEEDGIKLYIKGGNIYDFLV